MHKFTCDDRAFCTLREFLNTDKFSNLWNNRSLTKKVVFYRDSLGGDILTEEEACVLNEKYRPVEEEVEATQPEPSTPSGPIKRRSFEEEEGPATAQSSKRRARWATAQCPGTEFPSLSSYLAI